MSSIFKASGTGSAGIVLALAMQILPVAAYAAPPAGGTPAKPAVAADMIGETPVPPVPADGENAAQYCKAIGSAAADARFARQAEALTALQADIDERVKLMEAKRAELEEWLQRREDFLRKADESIVAIFTQMRPDAASLQMALMEEGAAAAILVKLTPRSASSILNEMEPAKAARLTTTMAGMTKHGSSEGKPG